MEQKQIAEEILNQLGTLLIKAYPSATTGDVDPLVETALKKALDDFINDWVVSNAPARQLYAVVAGTGTNVYSVSEWGEGPAHAIGRAVPELTEMAQGKPFIFLRAETVF